MYRGPGGLKILGNEVGIVFQEIRTICVHGQARWVGSKSSSRRVSGGDKVPEKTGLLTPSIISIFIIKGGNSIRLKMQN